MPSPADPHQLASLERRMRRLYALRALDVTPPGAASPLRITLPADPDAPLDRFAAVLQHGAPADADSDTAERGTAAEQARRAVASGARMPYWGLLWPSGIALAGTLLGADEMPLAGAHARALELGCGLGVTAAAALRRGLRLVAADCFAEALLFTRYNALRNAPRAPDTRLLDWRTPAGRAACLRAAPLDLLLAADVLYEEDDLAPLLDLAPRLVRPGGAFWLAEPGRRVSRAFVAAATARGWRDDESVYEQPWPPDGDVVRVAVHRFTHLAA